MATKADKIPKTRWPKHIKVMKQELGVLPGDNFIAYSSEIGLGKDELWELIDRHTLPTEEEPPAEPDDQDSGDEPQHEDSSET